MHPSQSVQVHLVFFHNARHIYENTPPEPATPHAAGVDLRACLRDADSLTVPPGERRRIGTGIGIEPLAPGIAGFVYSRSGLGAKQGLTVAQGVGVIDPDYRGEIMLFLLNTSQEPITIAQGERVAQLIFQPYCTPRFSLVEQLGASQRGEGGYGHTGSK